MLSRDSILTEDQARRYLARSERSADQLIDALNGIAQVMGGYTRRHLVDTIYREPVTIAGTTTINALTVAGAGFAALVYAGDDIRSVNLPVGCRVQAVTDAQLTLTRAATASGSTTLSVGTATERADGAQADNYGDPRILVSEWPVTALYAVRQTYSDGTTLALDTRGYRIDPTTAGQIILPFAALPTGRAILEVDYRAGYKPPSTSDVGHREWYELERIARRLLQINFRDDTQSRGRATDVALGGRTSSAQNWDMPTDIRQALAVFARVG